MASRIIVAFKKGENDPLGRSLEKTISKFLGIRAKSVKTRRAYIIDEDLNGRELDSITKNLFIDPVTERSVKDADDGFDWLVEVRYKAGVTNPVSKTATEAANQILSGRLSHEDSISTAMQYLISGASREEVDRIAKGLLSNPIIETASILSSSEVKSKGVPMTQYQIEGRGMPVIKAYDLMVSDQKLMEISKNGVLALSLPEMRVIKEYSQSRSFADERRKTGMGKEFWGRLTDVELEMMAQTQSEHCKHKIFNGIIKYTDENGKQSTINGLFGTYIRAPTRRMAKRYPWILSAFSDNAGIVDVGNGMALADKIETHNAPSALEPYGGAITGILGVNRDIMGAGIGARPVFNVFGYCFGNPFYDKELVGGILHPARIRNGVHRGVIDGGNQSGIALVDGFELFDDRFGFRPLVYCGTIGIMPKMVNGKPSEVKKAHPGDLIVMVGGRIGKDGIHGATFSSAELDKSSPVQAVQIGDSITQKKMADFLLEARDKGFYRSITDNGAGGLSSSVGEMARDTDGCRLDLKKAPLKYHGLAPWEILLSESQERMTVAVDPASAKQFLDLAKRRGVEATILGEFENTGKFHALYGDKTVAYLDMGFLHEGFPKIRLEAVWKVKRNVEPRFDKPERLDKALEDMLTRLNICSKEYKMRQYDHEVKGLSVVKPFVGKNSDVPSDATISFLDYGSKEGLIVAHGINPFYSEIDAYHMAASAIDEAIRRIIAVGGRLPSKEDIMYGLDNFCWNISSLESEDGKYRMAQLVRANQALAEYCEAFGVPCISGKDSMKNVWKMKDTVNGKEVERSIPIPPTLLFSARAKIRDVGKAVTMDAKKDGDIVYVVGETYDELGASEYFSYMGEKEHDTYIGNKVPKVNAEKAKKTYSALSRAAEGMLVASIHTPTIGGLAVAFAQSAFAGGYGMSIDLRKIPYSGEMREDYLLFSQSNSRFVVTVSEGKQKAFEKAMNGTACAKVGKVTKAGRLVIAGFDGAPLIDSGIDSLKSAWKNTLEGL